jgi:hypothetical protein
MGQVPRAEDEIPAPRFDDVVAGLALCPLVHGVATPAEAPLHVHHNEDEGFWVTCGEITFAEFPPPDPDNAAATFAGIEGIGRLERLVEEVYGYYEQTHPMMAMVRRDLHRSQPVAEGFEVIRAGIGAFALEALKPLEISQSQVVAARAILDDRVWSSFVDAGMPPSVAKREGVALLRRATGL